MKEKYSYQTIWYIHITQARNIHFKKDYIFNKHKLICIDFLPSYLHINLSTSRAYIYFRIYMLQHILKFFMLISKCNPLSYLFIFLHTHISCYKFPTPHTSYIRIFILIETDIRQNIVTTNKIYSTYTYNNSNSGITSAYLL